MDLSFSCILFDINHSFFLSLPTSLPIVFIGFPLSLFALWLFSSVHFYNSSKLFITEPT